jgi:hypothetical protein
MERRYDCRYEKDNAEMYIEGLAYCNLRTALGISEEILVH